MPYPVMNTMLDAGYPAGSLNYWLSSFTRAPRRAHRHGRRGLPPCLPDDGDPVRALPRRRYPSAPPRPPPAPRARSGTSSSRRCGPTRPHGGQHPLDTRTHAALCPPGERRWLNYLGDDQADDAIRAAYGPNYDRLARSSAATTPTTSSTSTTTSRRRALRKEPHEEQNRTHPFAHTPRRAPRQHWPERRRSPPHFPAAPTPKTVVGSVGPGFTIDLTLGGKKVTQLKAGVG